MVTELPESEGAVLGVKITGKVSLEMEEEWIARVDRVIQEHGEINCLVFLDEHARWGLKAGIEDFKWLMTHTGKIGKIAIVADNPFWNWYVAIDRPFGQMVGISEKHFEPAEIDAAWKWLKEGTSDVIQLYDEATGKNIGSINNGQFQFLRGRLEEEGPEDRDYYINRATLDMLEEKGADQALMELLRKALEGREDMDILWSRE